VEGLESAWLFGSYARLDRGAHVVPGDVDLLIVGTVNRVERSRLESDIGNDLDMRVDVAVVSRDEWAAKATGFIQP
jgi:predicted nucleotidyltransferase